MADLCTIDAAGKIIERHDNNDDIWVDGVRYSQSHVASMTPDERAEIGAAWVMGPDDVQYDAEAQKRVLNKAGPGDDPTDTYEVVALTPEELAANARAELRISDLDDLPRVAEDFLAILLAKGTLAIDDFPSEAQAKIAKRQVLRKKL